MIQLPPKDQHHGITAFSPVLEQERQLFDIRLGMALDYIRMNDLNRIDGADGAKIGIVAAGKAWQDLSQALNNMGMSHYRLGNTPLRLLKIGAVWPLDDAAIREFSDGLDTLIVVEEKRPLLEDQIRALLYGHANSPRIIGKQFGSPFYSADKGETAFPAAGEISPGLIARVIGRVILESDPGADLCQGNLSDAPNPPKSPGAVRAPTFCAGCPHGRSTQVPKGSRALAGIGCHTMAVFRDPTVTNSITQMGGEGAAWLGQSHFTDEKHVFANMGDGTYFHSGLMAIRAAVAAKVTITYKILHNGFVSMTGGQPVDGDLDPITMARQLFAEGVLSVALVSDDIEKYRKNNAPDGLTLHSREELETVQKTMRDRSGVTAIIYDQPCATERRRLRKRNKWPDPDKRVFINPEVCEGCGDCSSVSNCMAIEPLETGFGRKRQINQSSCNKDFSCLEGFCPSLVTVSGARLRKKVQADLAVSLDDLPEPNIPTLVESWSILVSGIGGAGVVTIGQTLAVAAHIDGWFSSNLDITGLAQKYGAVHSHIKIARTPSAKAASRIAVGEANALIGCDLVVAAGDESLSKLRPNETFAVVDTTLVPTSEFSRNPDWSIDPQEQIDRLEDVLGDDLRPLDAQVLAETWLGEAVFANMILVGAAWQQGALPLTHAAIMRAIELNGAKIPENKRAFNIGRQAYIDRHALQQNALSHEGSSVVDHPETFEDLIKHRSNSLRSYQNDKLANRYLDKVQEVREALRLAGKDDHLARIVATHYYRLLAVKDEWEVARLYASPSFEESLKESFEGDIKLTFHFGAWPIGRTDPKTGKQSKGQMTGRLAMAVFRIMHRLRGLRGTVLDPFRNNDEARLARQLLAQYETDIDLVLAKLRSHSVEQLSALLSLPEQIRGFGHIRERNAKEVAEKRSRILAGL